MEELSDNALRSALISMSGDIYDSYDVERFLSRRDFTKSIGQRFLSWLIRLGIIPAARSEWVQKIQQKYSNYKALCHKFFKENFDDPLKSLPKESSHTIEVDIMRTYTWFLNKIADFGISESILNGTEIRAKRILSAITLDNSDINYTQGHDRYVWISLIVSIIFTIEGELSMSFAEAISYYMAEAFITFNPISSDVSNFGKVETHFSELDQLISEEIPQTSALLKSVGNTSMHFALKWELTLFADEHNIHELMIIWDHILVHIDDISDYVQCLCVSHIKQVPCTKMADEMAQAIQRHRVWNVFKILDDSEELLTKIRGEKITFIDKIRMFCFSCYGNCY